MGQKVNPTGFRLGVTLPWQSKWFASGQDYQKYLLEDIKLRHFLKKRLQSAGLAKVDIERSLKTIKIILHVARPGVAIGRGGSGLEDLKNVIQKKLKIKEGSPQSSKLEIAIEEIKNPELNAELICQSIIQQLEKRMPHRRVIGKVIDRVMSAGAQGIKIVLSGRIAGAEISRTEKYAQGEIPLQTIRADIDYSQQPALIKSGYIGVKVWIYKGEKI